jgi:hypothetical protein
MKGNVNMKMKVIATCMVAIFLLSMLSAQVIAHTAADPYVTDLVLGQKKVDVGDLEVWNDGVNLYVRYVLSDTSWGITQTHLHIAIADDGDGIPQKKGNPIPGHFDYQMNHDPSVTEETYVIPLGDWTPGTVLDIAAHAVGCQPGTTIVENSLPAQVMLSVVHPGMMFGGPSYFDVTISGGTQLDGMHDGWCVDAERGIDDGTSHIADVYSSYESLPDIDPPLVDYPENLDLMNWVLNQGYVGQSSPSGGTYTYSDVQRAIWELIDDNPDAGTGLGDWSQARVDEIVAAAIANGEGFVPGCGDVMAIILLPKVGDVYVQPLLIVIPVPCPVCGTIWAEGLDFPGKNWAMYFTYTVQ